MKLIIDLICSVLGGDDGEGGSSGEEWIMRGDLTKKKRKIVFGDGSDFRRPGWEEELIDFKKKLRMPQKLIQVAKPSSLTMSPTQSAASSVIGEKGSTTTSNATSTHAALTGSHLPASTPSALSKDESSPAKSAKENKIPIGAKGGKRHSEKGKDKQLLTNDSPVCLEKEVSTTGSNNKKVKGRPPKSANMNSSTAAQNEDDGPPLLEPMLPVKPKGKSEKGKGKGKKSKPGLAAQQILPSFEKKSDTSDSPLDDPTIEKAVERMKAAAKKDKAAQAAAAAASSSSSSSLPTLTPVKTETLLDSSKGKSSPGGKISGGKKGSNKSLNSEEDLPLPSPLGTNSSPSTTAVSSGVEPSSPANAAVAPTPPPAAKKGFRRNKFKSGFDYIRKKKKIATNPDGSVVPPPPKKVKVG
jgi:hypothetical protein